MENLRASSPVSPGAEPPAAEAYTIKSRSLSLRITTILIAILIIWFFIWIILYATAPSWVVKQDPRGRPTNNVDPVACLALSLIAALVIVFILCILYFFLAPSSCQIIANGKL